LIRRNGQVVPWYENKIEVAVRKAFLSMHLDSEPAVEIARGVTRRAIESGQAFINIEDAQDLVQEELMRQGFFKVAETYILYRSRRALMRAEEQKRSSSNANQDSMIVLAREDGQTFFWDGQDLKKRIEFGLIGLELSMSPRDIEQELRRSLFAEMKEEDLKKTIILNAKALLEKDADFAKFAGRILLTYIYEEVLGWNIVKDGVATLKAYHKKGFKDFIRHGVKIERLDEKLLNYDLDRLADVIDPSADLEFDYLGIQTLYDRYLIVDKVGGSKKRRIECPQLFWMRVSMGLFIREEENAEDKVTSLYNLYKSRRFCSSTPTLFNSGTRHSQLSSCYLYKVDDDIESIMYRGIAENAFLSKWAGGLGGSWTAVRGTGSYIKGTNGESQGVIPFLKLHNDQLVAVNQGGKRRGSGCAYLETWHSDILDFLELRKNVGDDRRRTHDMNTANWIPDLFMKRMENRADWTLFRSNEVPDLHDLYGAAFEKKYCEYEAKAEKGEIYGQKIPAIQLWRKMLTMLFETGHPWITFKDPCNLRSPQDHAGVIHSSNLCTEITLNTSKDETAVCNLGSIILDSHLTEDGYLDHAKLKETISIAVRALDNVIDINFYPTQAARNSNERHRPIGLGVMGVQAALYKKNVAFASNQAVEFNDEFMEAIAYYAYEASSDLAAEKGTYSSYKGSKWDRGILPQDTLDILEKERGLKIDVPGSSKMDWTTIREKIKKHGMRNSNVLAIAPTATISNITGTTPCIEPLYKNLFVRSNLSGDFIVLNQYLVRDLKKLDLWDDEMLGQLKYFDGELKDIARIPNAIKEKYATAFNIDFNYFIAAAARRQKWIDQSQSVNLFLSSPNIKTLSHMYRAAWHQGLKTTYYLRTLGASNIEKATISVTKDSRVSSGKKEYTAEEKMACSIEAMRNGEECEACQ
jgi:ribonucleoside-diphosphate reductase alpha chain